MKKFIINRILMLGCFSLITALVHAQSPTTLQLRDAQGMAIRAKSYTDISGSPYLTADWTKATVKQQNGQTYNDVNVRYDLIEDLLTYQTANGTELAFVIPIVEFNLTYNDKGTAVTRIFRNGFTSSKGSADKTYYEVLHDGQVKLLKKHAKQIETTQAYNSPPTKSIADRTKYYYTLNNELVELKKDAKSIGAAFGSKSETVQQYIKDNKLNLKKDEDLTKVFAYHSSL